MSVRRGKTTIAQCRSRQYNKKKEKHLGKAQRLSQKSGQGALTVERLASQARRKVKKEEPENIIFAIIENV